MKYICKNANAPYKNREWLKQKYQKERLFVFQIAEECGYSRDTIKRWMDKFGIKTEFRLSPKKLGCRTAGRENDTGKGYVAVTSPLHPHRNSGGYVFKHRLVAEEELGRFLLPKETIHHRNKNRGDNRPENLMLFPGVGPHILWHKRIRDIEKKADTNWGGGMFLRPLNRRSRLNA